MSIYLILFIDENISRVSIYSPSLYYDVNSHLDYDIFSNKLKVIIIAIRWKWLHVSAKIVNSGCLNC